jgi:uncharacterized GH25 family protein
MITVRQISFYTGVLFCFHLSTAGAQEIWLRPEKYFHAPGEYAVVQFQRGDEFKGDPFVPQAGNILRVETWNSKEKKPFQSNLSDEKTAMRHRLVSEGYEFIYAEVKDEAQVNARAFADFLKQYGLEHLMQDWRKTGDTTSDITIRVTHYLQLALRSGRTNAKGWNTMLNLPVEIVPDKNPQTLRRGDRIHFTVFENGSPSFGTRVKVWNRWDNRTTIQNIYTEKDGVISTTVSNPGDWMVNVFKLRPDPSGGFTGESFVLLFGYR